MCRADGPAGESSPRDATGWGRIDTAAIFANAPPGARAFEVLHELNQEIEIDDDPLVSPHGSREMSFTVLGAQIVPP
jgi:hypothetical protein